MRSKIRHRVQTWGQSPAWHKEVHPYFAPGWPATVRCDNGWRNLILTLIHDIDALHIPWRIRQIKEKFGSLRVYAYVDFPDSEWLRVVSAPNYKPTEYDELLLEFDNKPLEEKAKLKDKFNTLIADACIASDDICESCGNKGKLKNDAVWIRTLCDPCYDLLLKEKGNK